MAGHRPVHRDGDPRARLPGGAGRRRLASGMFIALNFLVDLLYGWLDPRIRFS
jgi:hypothetical protein